MIFYKHTRGPALLTLGKKPVAICCAEFLELVEFDVLVLKITPLSRLLGSSVVTLFPTCWLFRSRPFPGLQAALQPPLSRPAGCFAAVPFPPCRLLRSRPFPGLQAASQPPLSRLFGSFVALEVDLL